MRKVLIFWLIILVSCDNQSFFGNDGYTKKCQSLNRDLIKHFPRNDHHLLLLQRYFKEKNQGIKFIAMFQYNSFEFYDSLKKYSDMRRIDLKQGYELIHCQNPFLLLRDGIVLPTFKEINEYNGYALSDTLNSKFSMYLIESKIGQYLQKKYLVSDILMPSSLKHGISKGLVFDENKNRIIFWVIGW